LDIDAERRTMEPLREPHQHGHQDDPWIIHECPSSTTHANNRPTTPTHRCLCTGSGGLGRCEARHLHDTRSTPDCQAQHHLLLRQRAACEGDTTPTPEGTRSA
jgi:hypothetical protein